MLIPGCRVGLHVHRVDEISPVFSRNDRLIPKK